MLPGVFVRSEECSPTGAFFIVYKDRPPPVENAQDAIVCVKNLRTPRGEHGGYYRMCVVVLSVLH